MSCVVCDQAKHCDDRTMQTQNLACARLTHGKYRQHLGGIKIQLEDTRRCEVNQTACSWLQSEGIWDSPVVQQHSHSDTHDDSHHSWNGDGTDRQTGTDTSNEDHSL